MAAKILVVDDDEALRQVVKDILDGSGYETSFVGGGKAVFGVVTESRPDVILLDVMMSDLDGFEVCRRLKADSRTQAIKIIMMTALNRMTDVERALSLGADDYIMKPFDSSRILKKIEKALAVKS